MFGYIRPFQPELRMREYGVFRSVYCGVCHSLRKRYGLTARFFLSYDAAFLALLRLSGAPECPSFCKKRCVAHPFRPRSTCAVTEDTLFAADVAVILFYYKLRDGIRDSGFFKKTAFRLLMPAVSRRHKKAARLRPEAEKAAQGCMERQEALEGKGCAVLDEAADPTAGMLARLLELGGANTAEKRILSRLGYFLGRWIYLADAADDLPKDMRAGRYNPFAASFGLHGPEEFKEHRKRAEMLLNACLFEMGAAFELLPRGRFADILRNVLYFGLPDMHRQVLSGRKKKQGSGRFDPAAAQGAGDFANKP